MWWRAAGIASRSTRKTSAVLALSPWQRAEDKGPYCMADTRRFTVWSLGLLAVLFGLVTIWDMRLPFAATRSADLQTQVKELTERVQELEAKLACLSKDGDNVVFEKCNIYIRSGSGQTGGAVNGGGN